MSRHAGATVVCLVLAWLTMAGQAADGKTMSVQVKTTQVRESASFMAKPVQALAYGDQVAVLETQGAWMRVKTASGVTGWVNTSALTAKRVMLASGSGDMRTGASADEVATAGKGFNAQVESEFKAKHRDMDFSWIDRMEKWAVSADRLQAFLAAGEVTPRKGGAQ